MARPRQPKPTDALRLIQRVEKRRAERLAQVPRAIVSIEHLAGQLGMTHAATRAWLAERGIEPVRQGGGDYVRTADLPPLKNDEE